MTNTEILHAIENASMTVFGIRADDAVYQPGDELPCSHNMVDDLWDAEAGYPLLDGTCATGIGYLWHDGEKEDIDTIRSAVDYNRRHYDSAHQYLIAGTHSEYGDDPNEIIIKWARVIAVIC